jgi:hypothetical protein
MPGQARPEWVPEDLGIHLGVAVDQTREDMALGRDLAVPFSRMRPMVAIYAQATPMSARYGANPLPSITVPLRMTTS